ncbi:MAG: hypothetical protein AAF480_08570 [Actinomycetota bacterium]
MNPHRLLIIIGLFVVLAVACGADDDPSATDTGSPIVVADPTAPPEPTADEVDDQDAADTEETTGADPDLEDDDPEQGPASALPILTAHDFDEAVYSMVSVDGYVVAATGTGLVRLDIDTGEQVRVHVADEDDPRLEPFWIAAGDHHVLVASDRTREGAIDALTAVDIRTMERVARIDDPAGVGPEPTGVRDGVAVITSFGTGPALVDTATLEPHASGTTLPGGRMLNLDGEIWHIGDDGSGGVIEIATGAERGSFDGATDGGSRFGGWEMAGPGGLWFGNTLEATLHRVDRDSLEVTAVVDLKERYPDAAVDLMGGDPRDGLVELSVVQDGVQWLIVAGMDTESGEVLWDHVFSQFGTTAGFTIAERAAFVVEVDGRIFVRDHARRIVEVDTARVGTTTGPWVDPGLPSAPSLDEEQQEALDTVRRYLADRDSVEIVPPTDASVALAPGAEEWPPRFVTILDDRAFLRIWPGAGTDKIGVPFSLDRSDDGWTIDGRLICHLASFTAEQSRLCDS